MRNVFLRQVGFYAAVWMLAAAAMLLAGGCAGLMPGGGAQSEAAATAPTTTSAEPMVKLATPTPTPAPPPLGAQETALCQRLGLDPARIAELEARPIYTFSEKDLHDWLPYVHEVEPELSKRVVRIGRKNIGQPYEIYLLGEFPFELIDPQPLYCLPKSDCLVFSEHTYAMSLSRDWPSFFAMLQRIRYKDGRIGFVTRNHWTTADWDPNNAWLVRDITAEVGGDRVKPFYQKLDRAHSSLYKKNNIQSNAPVEEIRTSYIPFEILPEVQGKLRDGDFVNIIYDWDGNFDCAHTGLVAIGADGTAHFLHSSPPAVREEPFADYISRAIERNKRREAEGKKDKFVGFRFLRLQDDPLANLRAIDGPDAPRIYPPLPSSGPSAPASK